MDADAQHDLVAASAALASVHARTSDFIAQIRDALTAEAARHPDRLRQIVKFRTEAAELIGQGDDAVADIQRALAPLADERVV
jgi:ABC-type transporter Mla subunit MlaD